MREREITLNQVIGHLEKGESFVIATIDKKVIVTHIQGTRWEIRVVVAKP